MSECDPRYDVTYQIGGSSSIVAPQGLRSINWERRLDDIGTARFVYVKSGQTSQCCQSMGKITPWRDSVNIIREGRIVWFGTVMTVEESRDEVVIEARDPLVWLTRRIVRSSLQFTQTDLTDIARRIIDDVLSYANPWAEIGFDVQYSPSGTLSDLLVEADRFPRYAWNVLTEKLATGLDVVTVGKTAYFGPAPPAATVRLRTSDFEGDLSIRKDGNIYAAKVFVNANDDVRGEYPTSAATNPLLVEKIISDAQIQTQEAAENHAKAMWAYSGQQGVPVIVQASDSLSLNPNTQIKLPQLVPGAQVQLTADNYCFGRTQAFRLGRVTVDIAANVEDIQISLQPVGPQALSDVTE